MIILCLTETHVGIERLHLCLYAFTVIKIWLNMRRRIIRSEHFCFESTSFKTHSFTNPFFKSGNGPFNVKVDFVHLKKLISVLSRAARVEIAIFEAVTEDR